MRVLQIGSDRSKRGILYPDSPAIRRQAAYGEHFDALDIIGFSLRSDGRTPFQVSPHTHVYPTNSLTKLFYGLDTIRIVRTLPKPDVISAQDPFEVGLLALLIARMLHVPLHVQVHTDFLSPAYSKHSFLNRIRVYIAGFVLRRAKRIRTVSSRVKKSIEDLYHVTLPISVLPIFVDVEVLRTQGVDVELMKRFSKYERKILVVARLEPEKKVGLAIGFFAQVVKFLEKTAPINAVLIIVGDGSERKDLETLASNLKISDRVSFEGSQDSKPYYSIADLVLVTSEYEGYGLVAVEGLAAGKQVISTDVGNSRDAGAMNFKIEEIGSALVNWFKSEPQAGELKDYPYANEADYIQKYCDDIVASIKK